jgi:protein MpaA
MPQYLNLIALAVSSTIILSWSGCAAPLPVADQSLAPAASAIPRDDAQIASRSLPDQITIGTSVKGRPITGTVYESAHPARTTLILATIHGNEAAGTPLLEQFEYALRQNPSWFANQTIILIPIANPDGYARNTRHNANSVDLNRNFPADNRISSRRFGRAALSEPEAQAIFDTIAKYHPDQIISIHQMQAPGGIDYDGPASELAFAMQEAGPLRINRLGAKPGSLGSYASMLLDIPIITLELPRGAERMAAAELYDTYGPLLHAALGLE